MEWGHTVILEWGHSMILVWGHTVILEQRMDYIPEVMLLR